MSKSGRIKVVLADTWLTRFVGLLDRSFLSFDEALLLKPCSSIHTFGMSFNIDVVFLGNEGQILKVENNIKPNRICIAPNKTHSVLELSAGNAVHLGIRQGSILRIAHSFNLITISDGGG